VEPGHHNTLILLRVMEVRSLLEICLNGSNDLYARLQLLVWQKIQFLSTHGSRKLGTCMHAPSMQVTQDMHAASIPAPSSPIKRTLSHI
jgi:hypothetical protein